MELKPYCCRYAWDLDKQHLFYKPIRGIYLFRIPVPEVVFLKWHRGEPGVRTYGPDDHTLPNILLSGGFDQLDTHDCILVEKLGGTSLVVSDSADPCGKVDNDIRILYHTGAVLPDPQINLMALGDSNIFFSNSFLQKLLNYPRAKEPCLASNEDFFVGAL